MPRLIFKVNEVTTIEGRGVLVIGDWQFPDAQPNETIARKGDAIELRMPSGKVIRSRVDSLDYPRRDILIPPGISKADIEQGTEIYSLDAQ